LPVNKRKGKETRTQGFKPAKSGRKKSLHLNLVLEGKRVRGRGTGVGPPPYVAPGLTRKDVAYLAEMRGRRGTHFCRKGWTVKVGLRATILQKGMIRTAGRGRRGN